MSDSETVARLIYARGYASMADLAKLLPDWNEPRLRSAVKVAYTRRRIAAWQRSVGGRPAIYEAGPNPYTDQPAERAKPAQPLGRFASVFHYAQGVAA